MDLSSELLAEFARATRDVEIKTEHTQYGTIVVKDGRVYVKLDGSEILTPVYTTVDTKDGERVVVMIKNHTAIVTGNITTPAARTTDVRDLSAGAGRTATDFILVDEDGVIIGDHTNDTDTDVHIRGKSLHFYIKSAAAVYKPYYEFGDSINVEWTGAGYILSSEVHFSIPLAKPVIGTPNVVMTFVNGLTVRQNGSSDIYTQPTYSATLACDGGIINVIATISSTAAIETLCGVTVSASIAFS